MRRNGLALLAAALILTAGSAWAEEIVYFTNGTTMPIRAHEIRAEMIHVDLGGDSFMAFPVSMVDKIETAGAHVLLDPSATGNKMINSGRAANSGSRPARGTVPSRYNDNNRSEELASHPKVEQDEKMGVAIYRPHKGSGHAAKERVGFVATPRKVNAPGKYRGTKAMGTRNVIGLPGTPTGPNRSGEAQITDFAKKEGVVPRTPPKTNNNNENSSSSSSSSSGSESGD
jgi:hypothetical protein